MLAISRFSPPQDGEAESRNQGKTYAWGKNSRGQLGIGNTENQFEPQALLSTKERFKKVACGTTFSLGLSATGKVYFWGNFKYFGALAVKRDVDEPAVMAALENSETKDIACCYKYCVALVGKGELRTWGKHLLDKG
jgi:alpha-tubulin suppressor-like RCC1 family protein